MADIGFNWKRVLRVMLTSSKQKKSVIFGNNKEDNLNIQVDCHKYLSSLKDTCTVKISNLTYAQIVRLIYGEYYDISIDAGYENGNVMTIFKGSVLYISNSLDDTKTNTVIILCGSKLIGEYCQERLNLSLNSGINMYSALKFICKRAGIPESNVSTQFKKEILTEVVQINDTAASWIDKLCSSSATKASHSDSVADSIVSIFDTSKNYRIFDLNSKYINLSGGFPQLTSDGLDITTMLTYSFMCGDIIKIDNSIIDLSVTSLTEAYKNYGSYLDKDGYYMIKEIRYSLENRGSRFSAQLKCFSKNILSKITSENKGNLNNKNVENYLK